MDTNLIKINTRKPNFFFFNILYSYFVVYLWCVALRCVPILFIPAKVCFVMRLFTGFGIINESLYIFEIVCAGIKLRWIHFFFQLFIWISWGSREKEIKWNESRAIEKRRSLIYSVNLKLLQHKTLIIIYRMV